MTTVKRQHLAAYAITWLALLPVWSKGVAVSSRWDGLLKNNPFGDSAKQEMPQPEPAAQLELRGVLVEGGKYWFSVYDAATKREAWVQKNDMIASAQVKDLDQTRDLLTLESQGQRLALALKQTKLIALPDPTNTSPALAASGGALASSTTQPPASEPQRLEQVATQIRQRREQRLKQTATEAITKA